MNIKATRAIIGLVGKVEFPCGCYAMVAHGKADIQDFDSRHVVVHYCAEWKKHKWELADAERDLSARMKKFKKTV